jgi:cbb3-type cytochrome oxidase subunit 3
MLAVLALVAAAIVWLAYQPGNRQQVNEVIGEAGL